MTRFFVSLDQPLHNALLTSPSVMPALEPVPASDDASVDQASAATPKVDFQWVEEMLHLLDQRLLDLEQSRRQTLKEMQVVAIDLAVAATGKLLYEKIDKDEFPCGTVIQEIVQQIPTSGSLSVALHPKDLEQLENELQTPCPAPESCDA